ncbi:MAG: redoxin domain-containing protein [Isosphaeraceae bacterium]|nr:redoxin domain-containing protein [Isosphaeraceae bacterium]
MSKKILAASALIANVVLSATWAGWKLSAQRPVRPVVGAFHRSKVDGSGHSRGIVQVDLMRQIMDSKARSTLASNVPAEVGSRRVPTQDHPLVGHRAPELALADASGKTWNLSDAVADGPVVVVFYLGSTCVACVTHLVELDAALPQFGERGARVLAISGDTPEFSRQRTRRFGGFRFPLLSDADHAAARSYGAWTADPSGDPAEGEPLHGTFLVDRDGLVRWAYVGNRPFADVAALLAEVDPWKAAASAEGPSVSDRR